jgi:hypothetical protein
VLCEQLLAEIAELVSAHELDRWALRGLPAKNCLVAGDAARVEEAFRARSTSLTGSPTNSRKAGDQQTSIGGASPAITSITGVNESPMSAPEPASFAAASKPPRRRDKEHRRFISRQPCLVCGRQPSDPHHLRFAQSKALGRKVSDEFTVPLCRSHHRELHRTSNEVGWWARLGIDPMAMAYKLWTQTHPIPTPEVIAITDVGMSDAAGSTATAHGTINETTKQTQSIVDSR